MFDAELQLSHCNGQLFYKPSFAEELECNGSCCSRNGESKQMENALLQDMVKMNEETPGSSDVVTDVSYNITAVRWKDNKFMNVISTSTGK